MRVQPQVTICPPHVEEPELAIPQFGQHRKAVSKETRLAFNDIKTMHFISPKKSGRHNPVPKWANNEEQLQQVILHYLERKVANGGAARRANGLTTAERLAAIRPTEIGNIIPLKCKLQRKLNEYGQLVESGASQEVLARAESQIQNVDTQLVCAERGASAIATSVVYLYYRCDFNSVQIAKELHLTSVHVRQIISRMHHAWFVISGEQRQSRYSPGGSQYRKSVRGAWPKDKQLKLFTLKASGKTFVECTKILGGTYSCVTAAYRRYFGPTRKSNLRSKKTVRMERTADGGMRISYSTSGENPAS
jgi:hypothetical protein